MATGVVIAKSGFDITGSGDELYVDPSTELLKVFKNVSGAFSTDGNTWTSKGDYKWKDNGRDGSNRRSFQLGIPLPELDYIPQFLVYMDSKNNDKRMMLSNYLAGVSLEGDIGAFASAGDFPSGGEYPTITIYITFTVPNQLTAGEYGYYVQIFYDRIEAKEE